jgi:hypothetical protein
VTLLVDVKPEGVLICPRTRFCVIIMDTDGKSHEGLLKYCGDEQQPRMRDTKSNGGDVTLHDSRGAKWHGAMDNTSSY